MSLRRASAASLARPTSSFLGPRFLRAPAALATSSSSCSTCGGQQRLAYNTKVKHNSRKTPGLSPMQRENKKFKRLQGILEEDHITKQKFKEACRVGAVPNIMDLYQAIVNSPSKSRSDTYQVAQALHYSLRSLPSQDPLRATIFTFLDRVISDIRSGNLIPNPNANVHIISIFKESERYSQGQEFWQWLANQDDSFLNASVYGAAIELLANQGQTDLSELEELYIQALKRFPGTFAEYHLSPDAIVPDRTQHLSIVGIPITLLQGILTARVLAQDSKMAYLAFDTALRLFPSRVPRRFFELLVTRQPLSEAYTVFLIACRAGITVKPKVLTALLSRIRRAMIVTTNLEERMTLLRGMSNVLYAYIEAGGSLDVPPVSVFLGSFKILLPLRSHGQIYEGDEGKIQDAIALSAQNTTSKLTQAGFKHHADIFQAMCNVAGHLQKPDILAQLLNDMEGSRMKMTPVVTQHIMYAAADLKIKDVIKTYWAKLVSSAEKSGNQLSWKEWDVLGRCCRKAGCEDFAREQLQALQHTITPEIERKVLETLEDDSDFFVEKFGRPIEIMKHESFEEMMNLVQKDVDNIAAAMMSGQPLDLRHSPFSMSLDWRKPAIAAESDLRKVYDEFTTDPSQPAPQTTATAGPASPTGIQYGELRFQNWVSVVDLLMQAEEGNEYFQSLLDEAIAERKQVDVLKMQQFRGFKANTDEKLDLSTLRQRIRSLRSPVSSTTSQYS